MNIQGNSYLKTFPDGINTTKINDLADSVEISLTNNTIDLIGDNILVNGGPLQPGGGGIVTNPLNANLNIGSVYDIVDNSGLSLRGIDLRTENVGTGTNNQYFMGDGSLLQYSANSGNSNFYLYKSHSNTPGAPPDAGFVVYNNSTQGLATVIYISHLTDDNIDIEIFFNNINQINDVYLQDRNDSTNYIKYNITGAPTIVVGSYISIPVSLIVASGTGAISFGINHNILLSFFSNNIEVDSRLTSVETKTQYQLSSAGNTFFSGILTANFVKTLGGLSTEFLKANGTLDSNTYATSSGTQIISSVPFINALGQLSSNISNLFVQQGNNTIASAILAVQTGVGYSIQLSASSFTESLTLNKQNYILAGTDCPLFSPTTTITGNTLIGSNSLASTRIKIKDIKFIGNFEFISSSFNELRTNISNCEITGTLTFPTTSAAINTIWIYFFDCDFGGTVTIPNQPNYGIVFTRCNFNGQTITNNLTLINTPKLVFRECTGFTTLSLGNCIQYGMNATNAGVSKSQAGSFVKDLGTNSMFLKGDGSTDSTLYSYRKFSKIATTLTTYNLTTVAQNIISSTNGSLLFGANEAKIGDVYVLTMKGIYTVAVLGQVIKVKGDAFGSQFGFDGLIPFPSTVSGGTSYTYSITITILTATSLSQYTELTTSVNNSTTIVNGGTSVNQNMACNIANSSTFTLTALSSVASGNTIIPYVIYLIKY
jgi:hypothetical protein